MLKEYCPIIMGLISFLAPFAIVNIIVWKKRDVPYNTKMAYTIFSTIFCLFFTGAVLGSAILCGE